MPNIITPEDTNLWLPSALCSKSKAPNTRLLSTEWELRYAQAEDTLQEIRQSLCLCSYMYSFKRDWIQGQSANTRVQNALGHVEAKAAAAAERYHAAHTALLSLAPVLGKVSWNHKFKVLGKDDVCRMSTPRHAESEGRRQMSWIWLVEGVGDDQDEAIQDGKFSLRIEWCKAQARSMCWTEEVELLWEEMHMVSCFLRWHAWWWWKEKVGECAPCITADNEGLVAYKGLVAYACRQAQLRQDLADCFKRIWAIYLPSTSMVSSSGNYQDHFPDLHLPESVLCP
ncbi:hypothetical protein F4604DRAFT_1593059 [Suillus subluteus]|nr:hypothetical protein F4604DRAFT_1593059 [Suillus subluteus]